MGSVVAGRIDSIERYELRARDFTSEERPYLEALRKSAGNGAGTMSKWTGVDSVNGGE